MNKTKYRKKYDDAGIIEYLQYQEEVPYLFFWKKKVWRYVWKPYWNKFWGRDISFDIYLLINSTNENLDNFVGNYPNVETYFAEAIEEQEKLEQLAVKFWKENKEKKNKITKYESRT